MDRRVYISRNIGYNGEERWEIVSVTPGPESFATFHGSFSTVELKRLHDNIERKGVYDEDIKNNSSRPEQSV